MPLVPYKPDVEAWIAHFEDKTPRDPNAKWHPVLPIKRKIEEEQQKQPPIKINMITPVRPGRPQQGESSIEKRIKTVPVVQELI